MQINAAINSAKTLQLSLAAAELRKQGREIISLGLGEPEIDTPVHIREAAKAAIDEGWTRYSAPGGLPELRDLVAQKLKTENGIEAEAGRVVVTPGAKAALFLACAAALRPNDEVVLLAPYYVSMPPIVYIAEPTARLTIVPLGGTFDLDLDALDRAVGPQTRLLIINYPNNPTGRMLSQAEADGLADLMRRRPDLLLLSDEIYDSMTFGGVAPISPGAYADIADRVITVNGFGKAFAMTGWRIGYVHAPAALSGTISALNMQINTNTAAFIQRAAMAALTGPKDHITSYNGQLAERKAIYDRIVDASPVLAGSSPEGGYFAFLDVSAAGLGSDDFAAALLRETGVALTPGVAFGDDYDRYCRVSLVNKTELVTEGLNRIDAFVRKCAEARS